MKRLQRLAGLVLALILMLGCLPLNTGATTPYPKTFATILFTHDTHDHFLPMPQEGGGEYGGYTRLSTALNQQRAALAERWSGTDYGAAVITLDAGDFSMGSLFQTIYATDAPELRALGAMGYDVTTLGNHEFDYRQKGLSDMLRAAKASGDPRPAIVQANYKPPAEAADTWDAWNEYGITDYVVVEKTGNDMDFDGVVRFAVFGVLGVDADECAPMSEMEFEPMAEAAKRVVAEIQEKADADFIICLSHGGTDKGKGEDYELAKAVGGIDVIISGHTHSTTPEPIQVNDTLIVSCGEYTQNLGVLQVSKSAEDGGKRVRLEGFDLIPIDETIPTDPAMAILAEQFKSKVNEEYLSGYGLTYDQVLAESPFDFTPISRFSQKQEEDGLGNLIADSYIHAVKEAEGADYTPVDFAVVASGVIRASFAQGNITVSDAFNVSSLGSGGDGTPGYPLISVYITGKELKDAFEVDASVTPLMPAAQLYGAGMTWSFNPNRMLFNKVTYSAQMLEGDKATPVQDDKLYRVVTGLYSGQMLGSVNAKSFGILTITPKDKDGTPITDFESQIIHSPNGSEVKEWYALASYLQSMGTVDSRYAAPEGRKTVHPSWNPIELLKSPNWITLLVLAVALVLMFLAAFIVYRVVTRKRRRERRAYRGYRGR